MAEVIGSFLVILNDTYETHVKSVKQNNDDTSSFVSPPTVNSTAQNYFCEIQTMMFNDNLIFKIKSN